ncbi:hypothetical protein HQ560_02040 [bacterium]|nr:hypothetical protein [bacterium]
MPDRPRIVNIINFIRGCEPRNADIDLLEPVLEQIRLVDAHGLPATFLVQHDALCDERFTAPLQALHPRHEVGAWLEVTQSLTEAAGLQWRGRFPWDWHAHCDFTMGYTPDERERLADALVADFARVFGRKPESVGSWFIDAHTLAHLADRHGIVASCNCKDQVGTDGYTAWGGYWNQAYYPSRRNALMPAQTREGAIPAPVFRMLGSDPVDQYDWGLGAEEQGVVSLEPVYPGGGGDLAWVRWFFDANFRAPCLAFAYAQVGQENSFGWPRMREGLADQVALLAESGHIRVETLADSGRWFRETFDLTPATAVTALEPSPHTGRRSVWYESRFYRVNIIWEDGAMRVRDIHLFDETYPSRYLTDVVRDDKWVVDTLPLVDGFRWSTPESVAGLRPVDADAAPLRGGTPTVSETGESELRIEWPIEGGGSLLIDCRPDAFSVMARGNLPPWTLDLTWSPDKQSSIVAIEPKVVHCRHEGHAYVVPLLRGEAEARPNHTVRLVPESGCIVMDMSTRPH